MQTAAFFRAEGVLLKRSPLTAAAWLASNGQGLRERAFRLGQIALAAPLAGLIQQNDRTLSHRLAWAACRGMSEDRLAVLGEEYWDDVLDGAILESGLELVASARKAGHRIVVLSDHIESMVAPLEARIRGISTFVCNRLEIVAGETTGRLLDPIIGGHDGGRWVRDYAAQHDIDLTRSVAYGAHGTDLLLLSSVGDPCAVNADYTLRRAATEARWARLDYAA